MIEILVDKVVLTMDAPQGFIEKRQNLEEHLRADFVIYLRAGSEQLDNTSFCVSIPHQGKSLDELVDIALQEILVPLQKSVQALENRNYRIRWNRNR